MGRATGIKLGKLVEVNHGNRKKRLTNGDNRTERKLKKEIKQLRQVVAKASNELYRRKTRRKANKKEKNIIKELKASIGKETTSYNLRNAREQWLDTLRYKNIKLAKCEEKQRRKQDNVMFQRDQTEFFRMLEGNVVHEGEIPEMENLLSFENLGRYLGKRRNKPKSAMDGSGTATIEREGKPSKTSLTSHWKR